METPESCSVSSDREDHPVHASQSGCICPCIPIRMHLPMRPNQDASVHASQSDASVHASQSGCICPCVPIRMHLSMRPNQDASAHASQLGCICPSRHIHMCISIHAHTHTTSMTVNLHVPTSMYPERVKSQKLQKYGFWSLRVEHCIRHVLLTTQSDRHIRCTYAH